MTDHKKISLILTVYNEEKTLPVFLSSFAALSLLPDEVVITDAGSTDKTLELLHDFAARSLCPVKVMTQPGNRSVGRNAAIRASSYDIIACTDAGCVFEPDWLKLISEPLLKDERVEVVAGFYEATGVGLFEQCAVAVTLPTSAMDNNTFLPSARSLAFTKQIWEKVGGFPEDLDFAEDTVFDLRLKQFGAMFAYAPEAKVYWRPRGSAKAVFWQYVNYATGEAQAGIFVRKYLLFFAKWLLIFLLLLASGYSKLFFVAFCFVVIPYFSLWGYLAFKKSGDLRSFIMAPYIKLAADSGRAWGFSRALFLNSCSRRN